MKKLAPVTSFVEGQRIRRGDNETVRITLEWKTWKKMDCDVVEKDLATLEDCIGETLQGIIVSEEEYYLSKKLSCIRRV